MAVADYVKCNCCEEGHREGVARIDGTALEIRHRRHGTLHEGRYGLTELVQMLDPAGTTARLL